MFFSSAPVKRVLLVEFICRNLIFSSPVSVAKEAKVLINSIVVKIDVNIYSNHVNVHDIS